MSVSRRRAVARLVLVAVIAMLLGCSKDEEPLKRHDTATTCSPKKGLKGGQSWVSLKVDGVERSYLLHVPKGYDGTKRTPVVFLFHGLSSSSAAVVTTTQMDKEAERDNFILVAPQGIGDITHWDYLTPALTKGSDLGVVHRLVEDIKDRACVDGDRVYSSGFSNGSLLTLALACGGSDDFAAFGAVSGPLLATPCADAPARPIIYFHGTADPIVPFKGAKTMLGTFPPVTTALKSWAAHGGCDPTAKKTAPTKTVVKYDWGECEAGGDLIAYVVAGGGHRWPGGVNTRSGQDAGALSQSIDATRLMWEFFVEHPEGEQ